MADSDKPVRKIIHVDMDAFYASVEQRDDPELKGKPVAVGGGHRGVVTAASYEARPFGVRSAMPSVTAKRHCPELIFVKPRFDVYREVSQQIRAIFADYTDLVEPLSLDEAYLDVTEDRRGLGSARAIARGHPPPDPRGDRPHRLGRRVLLQVHRQARLRPAQARRPVRDHAGARRRPTSPRCRSSRFHGVGPVTARKMEALGIHHRRRPAGTGALPQLEARFGSSGRWYWRICRGIDEREVKPDRPYKSVSAERTFDEDLRDPERLAAELDADRRLCLGPHRARRGRRADRDAQGQVRRFHDHHAVEELRNPCWAVREFEAAGQALLAALHPLPKGIRLLGLGLHNLVEGEIEQPRQLGWPSNSNYGMSWG